MWLIANQNLGNRDFPHERVFYSACLICYHTVIGQLSHQGGPEAAKKAEELLERMQRMGHSVNLTTYNSVLNIWAKSRDHDAGTRAEKILEKMVEDEGVVPDIISFNTVLHAFSHRGQLYRAEALLERMLTDDTLPFPNTRSFSSVLTTLARSGLSNAADRATLILIRMQELHDEEQLDCKPNTQCYNAAINCLARSGDVDAGEHAERLAFNMQKLYEAGDPDIRPNIVTWNTVLNAHACSLHPDAVDRARALVQDLVSKSRNDPSLAPNESSYNTLIKVILLSKHPEKEQLASSIRRLMRKKGWKPVQPKFPANFRNKRQTT